MNDYLQIQWPSNSNLQPLERFYLPTSMYAHLYQPLLKNYNNSTLFTPRRVGGGGVKQLVLSVRPSVRCLSTQKSGYLAIYRVKRLLNTTVTLKSKKKMSGCVPDSRQSGSIRCIYSSFLFNNGAFCHFNTVTTRIR